MVQPTRIVCCACDATVVTKIGKAAVAANTNFKTIRIIPLRCFAPEGRFRPLPDINLSWFKQSGKPLKRHLYSPDTAGIFGPMPRRT
jgi:hypothetical protein